MALPRLVTSARSYRATHFACCMAHVVCCTYVAWCPLDHRWLHAVLRRVGLISLLARNKGTRQRGPTTRPLHAPEQQSVCPQRGMHRVLCGSRYPGLDRQCMLYVVRRMAWHIACRVMCHKLPRGTCHVARDVAWRAPLTTIGIVAFIVAPLPSHVAGSGAVRARASPRRAREHGSHHATAAHCRAIDESPLVADPSLIDRQDSDLH